MSSKLYKQVNYHADIDYFSGYIVEYDLRKANISALLTRGIINQNTYNYLLNADKQYREVYIGNMIKQDKNIYKEIQAGIIDAKRQFIAINDIKDEEILEIRNDAIYLLTDRPIQQQVSDYYFFAKKSFFTFYFKFYFNKDFFYRFDSNSEKDIIEIKGINDEKLALHQDYFLKFIADTIYGIERSSTEEVLNRCNEFYTAYVNRQLDIGFYREFNAESCYRISMKDKSFLLAAAGENNKPYIDINYNLRILRDLMKVVDSIYFSRR